MRVCMTGRSLRSKLLVVCVLSLQLGPEHRYQTRVATFWEISINSLVFLKSWLEVSGFTAFSPDAGNPQKLDVGKTREFMDIL